MSICLLCQAEMHYECINPEDLEGTLVCCCKPVEIMTEPNPRGGPTKAPEDMADPTSTGRKRAAQLKPIEAGMLCEWKLLARAGGGVIPIIGCGGNLAKAIHHGPDKDTTNNDDANLHRICTECHNRWHSLNDHFYGSRTPAGTPFIPIKGFNNTHDPDTTAELAAVYNHEMWWGTKAKDRPPYVNLPKDDE